MALELDWRACKEEKYAEALGFYMMFTDIGWELTEKNAADFYCRCKMHFNVFGPIYHYPDGPFVVTPEIVKQYIGLRANVSPRTWHQFITQLTGNARKELTKEYNDV